MATKLRLGPLPKVQQVKVTVQMPQALLDQLERYAAVHSQQYGESVDAATLIPFMLERFIANDRGFRKQRSSPYPV
ncbi:DUF2274 domain-containing protein [Alcaligenes faecalis]|uniref:DUF2274 domain-containing protein n=1 Tax=Alcaligenes faecalis TaxID=511 RepID=UPI001EEF78CD|nr:DUF2274 domain-containing protein [Alcaligenes faecalis]ULH06434.1 DUF2274 domain-containing protein [Alcaligenes faecalis]